MDELFRGWVLFSSSDLKGPKVAVDIKPECV